MPTDEVNWWRTSGSGEGDDWAEARAETDLFFLRGSFILQGENEKVVNGIQDGYCLTGS